MKTLLINPRPIISGYPLSESYQRVGFLQGGCTVFQLVANTLIHLWFMTGKNAFGVSAYGVGLRNHELRRQSSYYNSICDDKFLAFELLRFTA